ncbi:hypothetical protein P22_3697 [Propionispora sp. 2/2-37]|uniref:DAK2 domain-containing protein n=1 Tax=Propionispora sp. 2/2-37 TaxID=1677858 RepID=UPI0006C56884|nr:DAK2 domain-containing protein [Propionispora sp. 2/2-37]CUH97566.1 hypothetical protein P22_3697 [Propionispora sp. 2/2-37]
MTQAVKLISGTEFKHMIAASYQKFMQEHEVINNLNVFPVPDGDTGTNMLLTLGSVARALGEVTESSIGAVSKRAADSAIMGARGNSGVILSQLFRGLARGLAGKEQAASAELGKAFQYGVLYAYRAVARPVEGTILTVAKGIAKGAHRAVRDGRPFADILTAAIAAGEHELQRTPELLPALKAAGVVDAGGYGLIVFLKGCLAGLTGDYAGPEAEVGRQLVITDSKAVMAHPYCTEFLVKNSNLNSRQVRKILQPLGESLVLAEGADLLKIHIHTAHPGKILEKALTWGSLHDIKIDNMADQHKQQLTPHEMDAPPADKKKTAVLSVVSGKGLADMMKELGADGIIPGGQTMNPAVEDFLAAVHACPAETFILLPNNKNIILAANQVQKLLPDRVQIIPTMNVPQGMAALMAFSAEASLEQNVERMTQRMQEVRAAGVTVAVRDSLVDGRPVPAGSYIGVMDGVIVTHSHELSTALSGLLKAMSQPEPELVSLYYGSLIDEKEARRLAAEAAKYLPHTAIEVYDGGQPQYHFLISVE